MTGRAVFLLVLAALAAATGAAAFLRCEGSAPTLAGPEEVFLGREGATLALEAADAGSGLREVRVVLAHAKGESPLAERGFPGTWLRGGDGSGTAAAIEVAVDAQALGLAEGSAFLRASARDWSWRGRLAGNETRLEIPVLVDLTPPRLRVENGLTYVRRGGSGAVVYAVEEATARDGVEVADAFFPGVPLPGAPVAEGLQRLAIFALPRNAPPDPPVRVVAVDRAGNRRTGGWATRFTERVFEEVPIALTPRFLDQKIPELARELGVRADANLAAFQEINTRVRAENEARIRELVATSAPEKLWQGAFLQLPNSQVTSRFAEHRTYLLEGQPVSEAIHYGYDLATTARSPIVAANRGRVVFAGDLGIYGQTVILDHGTGIATLYGHLSQLEVAEGETVERGRELGRSGDTGLAGGDHLHFAILVGGVYVDPLEWWDPKWVREHVEAFLPAS
jgi:murein DD-endopeptidase MepM/ murein hydrolase activator NlpD